MAWLHGCQAIAWDLREDCTDAIEAARSARIRSEGWYSVARDPVASEANPYWMHAPHNGEWLGSKYPGVNLVAPYIGLNNVEAFDFARSQVIRTIVENDWCTKLWLTDIQGPPMGCGCGNPSCRSWDNSPGRKIVGTTPVDLPDRFFSEIFFESVMQAIWEMDRPLQVCPILCPGCERDVTVAGVPDPDGPHGTGLCRCDRPCSGDYWPELLTRFRGWLGSLFVPQVGLLLLCDALQKNQPVYGAPRNWPLLAHCHYGQSLFPCIEPADAGRFESCIIALDAPQTCWPVLAPAGYHPALLSVNS